MEAIDRNQTIDETKRKLQASREQLEGELEVQLQDVKRDAADFGKQVLLIGGGIYLSYRLLKSLTTSKEEKKRHKKRKQQNKKKNRGPGFGQMLMHQLLTMAVVAVTDQVKDAFSKSNTANDRKKHS
jgi:hypothetical protein